MNSKSSMNIRIDEHHIPSMTFRLNKEVNAGSFLRVRSNGMRALFALGVEKIKTETEEDIEIISILRDEDRQMRFMWVARSLSMAVAKPSRRLPVGSEVVVHIVPRQSDYVTTPGIISPFSGMRWTVTLGITGGPDDTDFESVCDPVAINLMPGTPRALEAYRKANDRIIVTRVDAAGNPACGEQSVVQLSAGDAVLEGVIRNDHSGFDLSLGKLASASRIEVVEEGGLRTLSNARPQAIDGSPIYFGEIHWHTEFSGDGQRDLAEALKSARDEFGLDFAGPADHISLDKGFYKSEEFSVRLQSEICRSFDDYGNFCTMPGAELSGRFGHCNLYTDSWELMQSFWPDHRQELVEAFKRYPYGYPLRELSHAGPEGRTLVVPHHTNTNSYASDGVNGGDGIPFWCSMGFPTAPVGGAFRLFEMVQTRGAYENERIDSDWKIIHGGYGGSAETALMRGNRFGFIAGTDNHCGWPTRDQTGPPCGVTGVTAGKLDTRSIFEALHQRRCYATTGARIIADATLNGEPIGSELKLKPTDERTFRISINGTAPIQKVQVISSGVILADLPVQEDCLDFSATWTDDRPGRPVENAWYYIRARQIDGHCVWLSPFWVDLMI